MQNNKSEQDFFGEDVRNTGSYLYYGDKLSCRFANKRINDGIKSVINFEDKSILDVGCGDGITAKYFLQFGAKRVVGIDPVEEAVNAARQRCIGENATFEVGDVYSYTHQHDCEIVAFSRVLHHMPDPAKAIYAASSWADTMLIIEPNGANPVLKIIEKISRYHREHGERSFRSGQIEKWLGAAGFSIDKILFVNLVPMFCSDRIASICKFFEPTIEKIPIIRGICCGQTIIVAKKNKKTVNV